jgi:hypothetical protein
MSIFSDDNQVLELFVVYYQTRNILMDFQIISYNPMVCLDNPKGPKRNTKSIKDGR